MEESAANVLPTNSEGHEITEQTLSSFDDESSEDEDDYELESSFDASVANVHSFENSLQAKEEKESSEESISSRSPHNVTGTG